MDLSDSDIKRLDQHLKSLLCLLPPLSFPLLTCESADIAVETLNSYLGKLVQRDDVINAELFRGLLETSSSSLPPLRITSEIHCSQHYQATALLVLPSALAICLEDTTPASVWDFVIRPSKGAVGLVPLERDCLRPVVVFNMKEAVTAGVGLSGAEAALGLGDGFVALSQFYLEDDWKSSLTAPIPVHSSRIIALCYHAPSAILVSASADNTLKVLQYANNNLVVVGGGSLKSRLTTASLHSLAIDPNGQKIYLGTSINRVLIYTLEQSQPKYLTSISTRGTGPVLSLFVDPGNILICDGAELLVWSNAKSPLFVLSSLDCSLQPAL